MIKSDLIRTIADIQPHLSFEDVEDGVNCLIEHMSKALENGDRIEIRGFGTFSLHKRRAWVARNPKSGEPVALPEKYVPHFKPGKALKMFSI